MSFIVNNLSHGYKEKNLFNNLNIKIPENKILGVIGPNGSGKSSLIRLLAGIEKPKAGNIQLEKKDLENYSSKNRAKKISYLSQDPFLHTDWKVEDIVLLGRTPYQNFPYWDQKNDLCLVKKYLKKVSLEGFEQLYLGTLSGGEKQRVLLARLLITESEYLLLDEATTALDIKHSLDFLYLCKTLCQEGKTIILTIHQLELAYRFCDFILVIDPIKCSCLFGKTKDIMLASQLEKIFQVKIKSYLENLFFDI